MKKLTTFISVFFIALFSFSQTPEKISYQAVIRNSSNALLINTNIGMQVSILQGSSTGTAVYMERHFPTTNANGLVSLEIGTGTIVSGTFSSINWHSGIYFIKTDIDLLGGSNYTISGTTQILSVPYALHSKTAEGITGTYAETDPVYSESQAFNITSSDISNLNSLTTNLNNKVDKVIGKSLSTNDYTTEEKTKLTGIATGAEVNVNADWNATSGDAQILNKPTTLVGFGITDAVTLSGVQTIIGSKVFSTDIIVNGKTIGRGNSGIVTNVAFGDSALNKNTIGGYNTANGYRALYSSTTAGYNTANGSYSLYLNTVGNYNTASGCSSLYSNTIGNYNTAIGYSVLYSNISASSNTAIGYKVLYKNTTGYSNTGTGMNSLYSNTTGYFNTAYGFISLYSNTTGAYNTANGYKALYSNTTGVRNTASGVNSLFSNITGSDNTANGYFALYSNTTGYSNTASGNTSLYNNTEGINNTAFGYYALYSNLTGSNNTAIGSYANVSANNLTNATAIGYNAKVNASDKIVLGNASAKTVGGYGAWTNYSDRRLKENIVYKNDLGLNFITRLNPVSFNYISDTNKRRRDGLIAQDVQQILNDLNIEFSGLVIDDDKDKTLNLSYVDLVIPLINAVKEQQSQIKDQQGLISSLEERMANLENMVISK